MTSKEEDNLKKSKASEVFEKYKFSKGNDKINSTSHVQPVNTYNNLRKNFNKRGLKSTLASSPIFLQKLSAAAATKESMKENNEICFENQITPTNKVNIEKNTLNGGAKSALPAS